MKRVVMLLACSCAFAMAHGQGNKALEEFRKKSQDKMETFKEESNAQFREFRRKINMEYAQAMRGEWREETAQPAPPPPQETTPLPPVTLPETAWKFSLSDVKGALIKVKGKILNAIRPKKQPQPVVPIEEFSDEELAQEPGLEATPEVSKAPEAENPSLPDVPEPTTPLQTVLEKPVDVVPVSSVQYFQYYGTDMLVRLANRNKFTLSSLSENAIADAWERLSEDDYTNTIYDCLRLRDNYSLCDWAYLQMIDRMAQSFLGKDTNEATLLTAYVFCQSGYRMRLGKSGGKLYLLVGTAFGIYNRGYYTYDGMKYFVYNGTPELLNIMDYPFNGEQSMDFYIEKLPKLAENLTEKRVLQSSRFSDMRVASQVNKNIIEFFNDYPNTYADGNILTRWAMYAETPVCTPAEKTVQEMLAQRIKGLGEEQALYQILNFVQTAFEYKLDDQVWGQDRAFFADETLFYPYCDCEDRAILFSRLVRNLLGLKVMLVYYPGHLAAAVCPTTKVSGDYILHEGKKFVICDPTYIGACVGMTMPGMNNASAQVILLN